MKGKLLLPIILMVLLAATRWPGLMPWNFSAVYALMFCAGVYFPAKLRWWLPFATVLITDLLLNQFYYHAPLFGPEMIGNYAAYAALVWLGSRLGPKMSFVKLLAGGLAGALLFYLITNTFSWLFNPYNNPEYTKNLSGWLTALTMGTHGWPQTWEFFRNTFTSTGLFTALFAGAMKLMEAMEPEEKEEEETTEEAEGEVEGAPEEAKA